MVLAQICSTTGVSKRDKWNKIFLLQQKLFDRLKFTILWKVEKFKECWCTFFSGYKQLKCLPAHLGLNNQEHMVSKDDVQKYRYIKLFSVVTGTADFIKKVQSFNDDYFINPWVPRYNELSQKTRFQFVPIAALCLYNIQSENLVFKKSPIVPHST